MLAQTWSARRAFVTLSPTHVCELFGVFYSILDPNDIHQMSYHGPDVSADSVDYLQSSYVSLCCAVAGSAVVLYDHLLTFNEETRLIWGERITSVNALFYFNRLFTFSWAVANLLDFVTASTTQELVSSDPIYILTNPLT
ncbi:hypothetical protein CERSUDRAFT_116741 [Gelatoporia subvermispora B]|uniref:DUF6533 domain-containing protein n=1 Tax=Ceriporiopsis subvermispora (strain B) TaxID=914234 RepID=M2PF84_CERS8|nr:hypothetical protein CERSUDRAFT_116741 [Gelatoporia subvermispora B]